MLCTTLIHISCYRWLLPDCIFYERRRGCRLLTPCLTCFLKPLVAVPRLYFVCWNFHKKHQLNHCLLFAFVVLGKIAIIFAIIFGRLERVVVHVWAPSAPAFYIWSTVVWNNGTSPKPEQKKHTPENKWKMKSRKVNTETYLTARSSLYAYKKLCNNFFTLAKLLKTFLSPHNTKSMIKLTQTLTH